jgi:membrane protease YdiL (CAAX protease family)
MKWLSPILANLTLWAGLFWLHSTWAALLGFHAVIIISLLIHRPNIHHQINSFLNLPVVVIARAFFPKQSLPERGDCFVPRSDGAVGSVEKTILRNHVPVALLFKSKNIKWIILNLLLCGSSGIILYFLWPILGIANDLPAQLQSLGLTSFTWPIFIAYFSLINPLIEEYFWRGFLGSDSKNLYISDPVYAGYHALVLWGKVHPFSIVFAVMLLTLIGWSWRQIAREDGGLFAPVLGHMAADFSITLCAYWMCK